MRIFRNCREAASEIKREVAEMGKVVKLKTYQDKNIDGNPDFFTKELLSYSYMIHEPKDKIDEIMIQAGFFREFRENCGVNYTEFKKLGITIDKENIKED